jgi:hypothetical protein
LLDFIKSTPAIVINFFHFHYTLPSSAMSFQQFFKKGHERSYSSREEVKVSQNLIDKPAMVQPIHSSKMSGIETKIETYWLYSYRIKIIFPKNMCINQTTFCPEVLNLN